MRMTLCRAALVLIPLLLGCGSPENPEVYIAPGVPFRLCAPREGPDMFITQEVVFRLPGGGEETALAALENRNGHFNVVASTPMGQTLFTVQLPGRQGWRSGRPP